jgi:hypothetical protein
MSPPTNQRMQALLYIENREAAAALNALLTGEGIAVTSALTGPEFREAVILGGYSVAVTSTWLIGKVCALTRLPVVNVEKFIYTLIEQEDETKAAKRFDNQAFVANVREAAENSGRRRYTQSGAGDIIPSLASR